VHTCAGTLVRKQITEITWLQHFLVCDQVWQMAFANAGYVLASYECA
jgi:hypothetical protein